MKQSNTDRFLGFVNKTDGCWLWTGGIRGDGYGRFWMDGENTSAHRAAYILFCGPIPAGKLVRHSCDTPLCTNPDHLQLGTHAENMRDMVQRTRSLIGEANGASKLKTEQAQEIIARVKEGQKVRSIAREMGIPRATVRNIAKGFSWRHLQSA